MNTETMHQHLHTVLAPIHSSHINNTFRSLCNPAEPGALANRMRTFHQRVPHHHYLPTQSTSLIPIGTHATVNATATNVGVGLASRLVIAQSIRRVARHRLRHLARASPRWEVWVFIPMVTI